MCLLAIFSCFFIISVILLFLYQFVNYHTNSININISYRYIIKNLFSVFFLSYVLFVSLIISYRLCFFIISFIFYQIFKVSKLKSNKNFYCLYNFSLIVNYYTFEYEYEYEYVTSCLLFLIWVSYSIYVIEEKIRMKQKVIVGFNCAAAAA